MKKNGEKHVFDWKSLIKISPSVICPRGKSQSANRRFSAVSESITWEKSREKGKAGKINKLEKKLYEINWKKTFFPQNWYDFHCFQHQIWVSIEDKKFDFSLVIDCRLSKLLYIFFIKLKKPRWDWFGFALMENGESLTAVWLCFEFAFSKKILPTWLSLLSSPYNDIMTLYCVSEASRVST